MGTSIGTGWKGRKKIGKLMQDLGYDILRVHKKSPYSKVEKLEKLAEFDVHGNIEFTDYALVPASMSESMVHHLNNKS
jgi:hypothetical protein